MNATKAFADSLKWSFTKQDYSYLIKNEGCSFFALKERIKGLFDSFSHCCKTSKYDLTLLKMKINSAVNYNDAPVERYLLSKTEIVKENFDKAEKSLNGKDFPSYKGVIRIDALAQEIVKSRIFLSGGCEYAEIKDYCFDNFEFEQKEKDAFDDAFEIAKCKVFCALLHEAGRGGESSKKVEELSALLFDYQNDLNSVEKSCVEEKAFYNAEKLSAELYCDGKSKINYASDPLFYQENGFREEGAVNYILSENKNLILSGFDFHKFSKDLFIFYRETKGLKVTCKVFYKDNSEIRLFTIENLYKTNRNLTFKLSALPFVKGGFNAEEVTVNGKKGVRWGEGESGFYMCASLPCKSQSALYCNGASARYAQEFAFKIKREEKLTLKTALTFAKSLEEITRGVEKIQNIDFFKCPFLFTQNPYVQPLAPLPKKCLSPYLLNGQALPLMNYNKVSVLGKNQNFLLDERGNAATLSGGYLTKPQGEQIYLIFNGKAIRLTGENYTKTKNGGEFVFINDFIQARVALSHCETKHYDISLKKLKPCQTSFLFTFSFKKQIAFDYKQGSFTSHACDIKFFGQAQSYTSSKSNYDGENAALYPDNTLSRSDFLAFTCDAPQQFCLEISPAVKQISYCAIFSQNPYAQNLYKEAKKYVYLYSNGLTPLSALSLSACAYASLDFLKEYLLLLKDNGFISFPYYDCSANEQTARDGYAFALALLNYTLLSGDKSLYSKEEVRGFLDNLLFSPPEENNKVLALLLLVKAAELTPRNSPLLLAAQDLTKSLNAKEKRMAELVGALKLSENSEQYLFSLSQEFPNVPICYVYIALFERLYGIRLFAPLLYVKPQDGYQPLPLKLNFCKKTYFLNFQKGNPCMKLNNLIMLPLLDCSNVYKGENNITVFH